MNTPAYELIRARAKRAGFSTAEYRERHEQGQKFCLRCRTWQPWPSFARRGKERLSHLCSECFQEPVKETKQARKCDYCNRMTTKAVEIEIAGVIYAAHPDCAPRAKALFAGNPLRDPIGV